MAEPDPTLEIIASRRNPLRRVRLALAAAILALPALAQEPTEGNLDKLRGFVLPKESECRWEGIPWKPTFWEAVVEANAKDRPILLWAMNGHPLGCT